MNYALDDIKNLQYEKKIKDKDAELLEYFKTIKSKSSTNEYLKEVLEDYEKYYKKIIEEKKKKETALKNVLEYLENIKETEEQTETQIIEDNLERKKILHEIDNIKHEIIALSNDIAK